MILTLESEELIIQPAVRDWCKMPYEGHPRGCPNYGKSNDCPPKIGIVDQIFDFSYPLWLGVVVFDLAGFAAKMKDKHPGWSNRQCRCCLYWQNSARKELKEICFNQISKENANFFTLIPEAMGVNVFRTVRRVGITLRRNPEIVYKIALIGTKKETPKGEENNG